MYGRIATRARVLAACFDFAVLAAIFAGSVLVPSLLRRSPHFSPFGLLLCAVAAQSYGLLDLLLPSGTPGKILLHIRIGSAYDGRPVPANSLAVRWFVKYLPLHALTLAALWLCLTAPDDPVRAAESLLPLLALAAFVSFVGCALAFDNLRQSLHDLAAGTAVFDAAVDSPARGFRVLSFDNPPPPSNPFPADLRAPDLPSGRSHFTSSHLPTSPHPLAPPATPATPPAAPAHATTTSRLLDVRLSLGLFLHPASHPTPPPTTPPDPSH